MANSISVGKRGISNYQTADLATQNNTGDDISRGIFNFKNISAYAVVDPKEKLGFSMFIEGIKREFRFKAETQKDRDEWVLLINQHCEKAKGNVKDK